ncbi:uncharacterized protein si:ch73-27e22.6 [Danio aesculapii]|uniref:uncharacterized protein si:ch73-27e22.6 n=1 Tax=Danio aesculapii TaxID=1142201 RepID=UPI0024BF54E6|nr:uncharacterized protein si:ch73-27e22.6 [Danio aesculapii]
MDPKFRRKTLRLPDASETLFPVLMRKLIVNMIYALVLISMCLWHSVDVTEEVKAISVMEGDSVTLHTGVTAVQTFLWIQWMFENTRIAEANRLAQNRVSYDGPDGKFRDRLKLDETGSLIIINTRTTDSGLYKLTLVIKESVYINFQLTVYENSSINLMNNQTDDANITDLHQTSSDCVYCPGFPETVIRLVICALVGVVVVCLVVYDVRSTRIELRRAEETRQHNQIREVKPELQSELSRKMSSRYVY